MADETDPGSQAPLRTFEYRLTPQDAVAYSVQRHVLTRGEKFKVMLLVGGAGLIATSLPQHWPPLWWWAAAIGMVACACVLAIVWTNFYARKGATKLDAPTGPVRLEEWSDRVVEQSGRGERTAPMDRISEVIATPQHVFLRVGCTPLIVPAAAFADASDMAAFAERIDAASKPVVP